MSDDAVTPQPDTAPPDEEVPVDIDPQIEPEAQPDDAADAADESDPEQVNTLINPENS